MDKATYKTLRILIAKINSSDVVYEVLKGKELTNINHWIEEVKENYNLNAPISNKDVIRDKNEDEVEQ